jgi:stalled ribosome alternative rescue factor ArfA
MELDRTDFQHKRKIVNVDGAVILSQILDGRKDYVTEVHTRRELFPKPELRDVFLYEEGAKGGFAARISQRVFVIGRIEREPDSSLVSVLLEPLFREKYSEAEKAYSGSVRKAKHKTQDAPVEVPKPDIMQNAQVKGDTLEIHVKNIVKEDVVPLHKDDVIVYREGVLTVEDASGEETHESFGVYGLKSEKDSLVLD